MCYSVQTRDQIHVKGYEFLYFVKTIGKNIGKKISKNVSNKHSEKFLDQKKNFFKKINSKKAEATGDFIE